MSTLSVTNLKNAASATNNIVLATDGSVSISGNNYSPQTGFKNRIINGAMTIDQRNAGAAVTVNTSAAFYAADRFRFSGVASSGVFTGQQIADAPTGFTNSLRVTVTTADASLAADDIYYCVQPIEGFNTFDLGFGSAAAQTVTLSFWTKSSLTGTFGGGFVNEAVTRSYPFTYTINAANTWEYKTVTVAGDTTGTWVTNNGIGLRVYFGLGVGSNFTGTGNQWNGAFDMSVAGAVNVMATLSATWQISGVQLEKGSVATPFEFRSIGQELGLCQRYCVQWTGVVVPYVIGQVNSATFAYYPIPFVMRATPTASFNAINSNDATANPAVTGIGTLSMSFAGGGFGVTSNTGLTVGRGAVLFGGAADSYLRFTAEL
jgi:hypothetical protein